MLPLSVRHFISPRGKVLIYLLDVPHAAMEDGVYKGFFIPKGGRYHRTGPLKCLLMDI